MHRFALGACAKEGGQMRRLTLTLACFAIFATGVAPIAQALPTNLTARTFAVGSVNNCVITSSGAVRCWGYNDNAQNTTPDSVKSAVAVTVGNAHICALLASGAVLCWGANESGQTDVPVDLGIVTAIDSGDRHTCAITITGSVRCWGLNDVGQVNVPSNLGTVESISAGGATSCAIASGSVACWGDNSEGQASPPTMASSAVAVSVGGLHACALLVDSSVQCWGNNEDGQTAVPVGLSATAIAVGDSHSCALTTSGTVRCWGNNMYGQINVPTDLASVAVVAAGAAHTCVATTLGTVRCWGNNDEGVDQPTIPSAPTLTSVTPGDANVRVAWQPTDFDGGSPVTSYRATASSGQSCTSTSVATTCTVSGLKNGTAVTVSVVAINATGASSAVTSAVVTPSVPLVPPAAPTAVIALPTANAATVMWTAPKPAAGVSITGYSVTSQPGAVSVSCKASPCVVTGLVNGTTYSFAVAAVSNAGNGASALAYATPNSFVVTPAPLSVKANASATFTISGVPEGAIVKLSGAAVGSATAPRSGVVAVSAAVAKSGVATATTTVAKVAYKATANVWVPLAKVPMSGSVGKPFAIAVSAARPGATATLTTDTGVTISQVVSASGTATLTFTPINKVAVTARVNVDGVDVVTTTVTVK